MPKPRRIKKEDIGVPSDFVHVHHVGFGPKPSLTPAKQSFNSGGGQESSFASEESTNTAMENDDEPSYVIRRPKASRTSMIPRHHRSTTTCIFPPQTNLPVTRGSGASIKSGGRNSIDSPESSSEHRGSLKPSFGSLLNLSFLPLGLGKTTKSPSVGKNKRSSLLNLTASNLFAGPKGNYEENKESVHMTSYIRRRSFSNSNEENNDDSARNSVQKDFSESENLKLKTQPMSVSSAAPRIIPLAKLGRSKSSMSEFTKRPKLRLKILPPVVPPPVPPEVVVKTRANIAETLPSPPPSPIPSPPPSPLPNTPPSAEEVALRKSLKSLHRPRIIPLPSTSSAESADPSSPQYLTPAGGSSPQPTNESSFPLLSPTVPPTSTPFFSSARGSPSTPPVWPLQPVWPTSLSIQRKDIAAAIPEVPSPCKEEMETSENEYGPVLSIVESFISEEPENTVEMNDFKPIDPLTLHHRPSLAVTPTNIEVITSVLQESIEYKHWPRIAEKLFHSIHDTPSGNDAACLISADEKDIYTCMLKKTLELWLEKAGNEAIVERLVSILKEENHNQATESLQQHFGDLQM